MSKPKFHILDERTVTRAPDPEVEAEAENPYWTWDELPPHPDPSRGCIQRGLCCRSHPGRFAPGEAEQAAALLGMTPDRFVRRYLIIDEVEVPPDAVDEAADRVSDGAADAGPTKVQVFAPVKLDIRGRPALPTGKQVDRLYRALRGTCVFFQDNGCRIYEARPWECRAYICTNAPEDNPSHADVGRKWLEQGA